MVKLNNDEIIKENEISSSINDHSRIKKKITTRIIIISIIVIVLATLYFFVTTINGVHFSLIGDNEVELKVFTKYKDKGVEAEYCTFGQCENLKKKIKIKDNIKSDKLGTYKVIYSLKYKGKTYKLVRTVKVVDKEKPKINLKGGNEVYVCPNKTYEEQGYEATDNYDGDLTEKVKSKAKKEFVKYSVKDSSGNIGKAKRKLIYDDTEKPKITLKGGNNISVASGSSYSDYDYIAEDNCNGDLTKKVKVFGSVNTNKVGTYKIKYEVTDEKGNKESITRTIKVTGIDTSSASSYLSSLNSYIKSKGYKVSVGYYNLATGKKYTYNPSAVYYGASLIKTLDALYIYENANSGRINLDDKLTLTQNFRKDYSAGMQKYAIGAQVSLRELVKYDIAVSDNTAHAMLINHIGKGTLKGYGNSLGGRYTLVGGDNFGNTIVDDQIAYMKKLYNYTNSASNGRELRSYFINHYYDYASFSGMPTFVHKYGHQGKVFHDVGIVLDKKPYILVILSNGYYENRKDIFQDISKKIYNYHKLFG